MQRLACISLHPILPIRIGNEHDILSLNGVIASHATFKVAADVQQLLAMVSNFLDLILLSQNGRDEREDPN